MITIHNKTFKTVLFDKDGTLFDSERFSIQVRLGQAQKDNFPLTRELLLACIGKSSPVSRKLVQDALGDTYDYMEYVKKLHQLEKEEVKKHGVPLRDGAKAFIQTLESRAVQIGLVTSSYHLDSEEALQRENIFEKFSLIIGVDDVENPKPNPEPYLKAVEMLKADKEDVIVFEDSPTGVEAALNAGLCVVYIKDLVELPEELLERVFLQLDTWREIEQYIS